METINHCPFCYGLGKRDAVADDENGYLPDVYFVRCDTCGAQGPHRDTPHEAISWWNLIHYSRAKVDWIEDYGASSFENRHFHN